MTDTPHEPGLRGARTRAFGLIEVLVALLLIALAALPLIQSGTAIHHQTYLTEFHLLATVRARSVLSLMRALDFEVVHRALDGSASGGPRPLDLTAFLKADDLTFAFAGPGLTNPLYRRKTELVRHAVEGEILGVDHMLIRVIVTWTIPAESRPTPREYRLATLLHRPESTQTRPVSP